MNRSTRNYPCSFQYIFGDEDNLNTPFWTDDSDVVKSTMHRFLRNEGLIPISDVDIVWNDAEEVIYVEVYSTTINFVGGRDFRINRTLRGKVDISNPKSLEQLTAILRPLKNT